MPTKPWEPPPVQQDRDGQPAGSETDQPRNLESPRRKPDANYDVRYGAYESEDINTQGSER